MFAPEPWNSHIKCQFTFYLLHSLYLTRNKQNNQIISFKAENVGSNYWAHHQDKILVLAKDKGQLWLINNHTCLSRISHKAWAWIYASARQVHKQTKLLRRGGGSMSLVLFDHGDQTHFNLEHKCALLLWNVNLKYPFKQYPYFFT